MNACFRPEAVVRCVSLNNCSYAQQSLIEDLVLKCLEVGGCKNPPLARALQRYSVKGPAHSSLDNPVC